MDFEKFIDPTEIVIETVLMKRTDIDEKTKREVAKRMREERDKKNE